MYKGILWVLFALGSFILLIHLLNMLIAIMGETFGKFNEEHEIQKAKSHLSFVMDNWWIEPIPKKERDKIRYIISAELKDNEDEDTEVLYEVQKAQGELKKLVEVKFEQINDKVAELLTRGQ
jgi:hypothetical protein